MTAKITLTTLEEIYIGGLTSIVAGITFITFEYSNQIILKGEMRFEISKIASIDFIKG